MRIKFALITVIIVFLTSCSEDKITPNDPNSKDKNDFSKTYFPLAIGAKWVYEQDGQNLVIEITDKLILHKLNYYVFSYDIFSGNSYYCSKDNNIYEWGVYDNYGKRVSDIDLLVLKEAANVGDNWTIECKRDDNATSWHYYEVVEKDIEHEVYDSVYKNVIHIFHNIKFKQNVEPYQEITADVDYFYAKGIGLIEFSYDFGSRKLKSYDFKNVK